MHPIPNPQSIIVTGRHVSAQEALKLGIVDQITDENACKMAVEFALRAVGMSRTCRVSEVKSSFREHTREILSQRRRN